MRRDLSSLLLSLSRTQGKQSFHLSLATEFPELSLTRCETETCDTTEQHRMVTVREPAVLRAVIALEALWQISPPILVYT